MFYIKKEAETALLLLKKNGFEAYLVGGCVRDSILGRPFSDYDITTNAEPEIIKNIFREYRTIETGIKHGTVTVIIDQLPIEITTYRIDGDYTDNRRPDTVLFSKNIYDDLSRRDFTINAIAYNSEYVDLFGGMEDIRNRIIRCVGDPSKRFSEDALRIMRALRFSSCLNFEIEEKTSQAILENRELLKNISGERIFTEFKKMLLGVNVSNVVNQYEKVFISIFKGENYSARTEYIKNCPLDVGVRLACFFANDLNYKNSIKKLKPDNKTKNRVCLSIQNKNLELLPDPISIKKHLRKYGKENLSDILHLKRAERQNIEDIESCFKNILKNNECYCMEQLDINGNDILSLGICGKKIGDILNELLDKVIENKIENKKEVLIDYAKRSIK